MIINKPGYVFFIFICIFFVFHRSVLSYQTQDDLFAQFDSLINELNGTGESSNDDMFSQFDALINEMNVSSSSEQGNNIEETSNEETKEDAFETIETDTDYFLSSIRDGSLMLNVDGNVLVDVEPVKNSRYMICVSLGGCPALSNTSDLAQNLFENVSDLTENQKSAYCSWSGKTIADTSAISAAENNEEYGFIFTSTKDSFRCMVSAENTTTEYFRFPEITEVSTAFSNILSNVVYPKYTDVQDAMKNGLNFVRMKDGMEEIYISTNTFEMGYDGQDSKADEKNIHTVSLSSYLIDKYEVSNSQYAICVKQGACTAPASKASYKDISYYGNPVYDNFPVIYVTWDQAEKYCEWVGMRLPTEAEWEYSARGAEGFLYPWGNDYNANLVNDVSNGNYQLEASGARSDDKSPFGVFDLGGNVAEWILDFYSDTQYNTAILQKNPIGPAAGYYHVIRGGSIMAAKTSTRSTNRASGLAASNAPDRGFRCANSLDMIDFSGIRLSDELVASIPLPSTAQLIGKGNLPADKVMAEGGEFSMGSSKGRIDESPVHTVLVSSFIIDKYEVTNEKYAACVEEGSCTAPLRNNSLRIFDYYTNTEYANYPVVNVTWEQAEKYCEWAGGRLPTEAEWEYAAGGIAGLVYPWGDEFSSANLNYAGKGINDPEEIGANEGDISFIGAMDMGGNVMEWVYDRYSAEYYKQSPSENPTGSDYGGYRVLRGSSYLQSDYYARISCRYYALEGSSAQDRGFRCVYPME